MSATRELTVRIRFTRCSLANQKEREKSGRFKFSRSPSGQIIFLAAWHQANFRTTAKLLNLHQDEVNKIFWDINIDGNLRQDCWYKVFGKGRQRYSLHEAFFPGDVIGINCLVPTAISDEDFWRLMSKCGQYCGLSPWKPGEWGQFEVVSVRPRQAVESLEQDEESATELKQEGRQVAKLDVPT